MKRKVMLWVILGTLWAGAANAFVVSLPGGTGMDVPEFWEPQDSEPGLFVWHSPDSRVALTVRLWARDTEEDFLTMVQSVLPSDADGDLWVFPAWDGQAALTNLTYALNGMVFRSWFMVYAQGETAGCVAALCTEEDFESQQSLMLSAVDAFWPSEDWRLAPGAVSAFLSSTGPPGTRNAHDTLQGQNLSWQVSEAVLLTSEDVIEREAVVLTGYIGEPSQMERAWGRYYRMVFRDEYQYLEPLARALNDSVLPVATTSGETVSRVLLEWLQSFEYGSTDQYSGLLPPVTACLTRTGDCDSLALAYLMLLHRYGIDGRLALTLQAHHAVAAVSLPGEGVCFSDEDGTFLAAEMTTRLPLGQLPERLTPVTDWYGVNLIPDAVP